MTRSLSLAALLAVLSVSCADDPAGFDLEPPGFDERADSGDCSGYPGGTLSGDDLLVLVNKQDEQQLASSWSPTDLVPIDEALMIPGRSDFLRVGAAVAFRSLHDDALAEAGFDLRVRSAYRSFATQCRTFDFWVETKGLDHARRFSAEPGRSQHQLGTTVDISSENLDWDVSADNTDAAEYSWLAANAHRFGFALSYPKDQEELTGYGFEPWHFRYVGHEAALELHDADLLLESYLDACQDGGAELRCPREEQPIVSPNEGFIGGSCSSDEDCASIGVGAICLDETDGYPGGYCSLPCTGSCPDRPGNNAITFCAASDDGAGLCHSRCDEELFPGSGCREGYSCSSAERPNGSTGSVCVPASE